MYSKGWGNSMAHIPAHGYSGQHYTLLSGGYELASDIYPTVTVCTTSCLPDTICMHAELFFFHIMEGNSKSYCRDSWCLYLWRCYCWDYGCEPASRHRSVDQQLSVCNIDTGLHTSIFSILSSDTDLRGSIFGLQSTSVSWPFSDTTRPALGKTSCNSGAMMIRDQSGLLSIARPQCESLFMSIASSNSTAMMV